MIILKEYLSKIKYRTNQIIAAVVIKPITTLTKFIAAPKNDKNSTNFVSWIYSWHMVCRTMPHFFVSTFAGNQAAKNEDANSKNRNIYPDSYRLKSNQTPRTLCIRSFWKMLLEHHPRCTPYMQCNTQYRCNTLCKLHTAIEPWVCKE